MSFLDSLENNLKALESREEKDPARQREELARQKAEKDAALAAAPVAQELKTGAWTEKLILASRTLGHKQRVMVRITWLDTVLRLEARELRLNLTPRAEGVLVESSLAGGKLWEQTVGFESSPEALAERWLQDLPNG
jgi:hypothetical protein